MGEFFANKWTKRVVSLLSPVYCALILVLSYYSIFYDIIVRNPMTVCILVSAVSLFAAVIMLYTRRQVLTIAASLIMLPGLLPAVLLYFGHWEILIPPLAVALLLFFFSGLGETAKTIFGTASLLLYLLGSLAYFLMTTLFTPATVSTTVDSGVSPSGAYRYEVINTVDRSDGSTTVYVESNLMDKDWDLVLFQLKGLSRTVMQTRPLQENISITWQTEKRSDITAQITQISSDVEATLSENQMALLGLPSYEVTYDGSQPAKLMAEEYHQIVVTLTPEEQAALETDKAEYMLDSLSENALKTLGITVTDLRTMPLSSLTEEDLTTLGIPEEGDVMYYNGKVCFRYYIAILEEYFDISKQELGFT